MPNSSKETIISDLRAQFGREQHQPDSSSVAESTPPSPGGGDLCLIEWTVESDQVILRHLNTPRQDEELHHLTVTELLQRVVPLDRKHVEQLVTYLINGELEHCEAEFRIFDTSGNARWVYGKGRVQQPSRQVAKIVGLITDSQTKEQVSDAPGSTYPFFKDVNALPVGIIQLDLPTGTIDTANEATGRILELPSNAAAYSFPDTDTADWVSVSETLYRQKQLFNKLLKLPSLNRWVLLSARRSAGDKATIVLQDVTGLKEESLALQKVNAELDNFVYHASHDLRTPLRSILGSLSLLRKEDNPQEREKCVELIEGSINRLDTFITDLLSISRNQQRENPRVAINFMVEVEAAVASVYHVGSTQNLEVVTKVSQPYPFEADLTRVRVVLNNLLSNAIKYRRYDIKRSYITVEAWVDAKQAHLKIADNGEGIAESSVDHIFDMFYRASERSEGSGLGLYIVKDVVEKLGGTITVRSKPGQGTTFSLTLPNNHTG